MQLIFISGPTGCGKTTLSNQILVKVKNGLVLSTDNYYKTGLLSKLLSKLVRGYFDKIISFDYKLFKKDFNFIIENGISTQERSYNFKKKTIKIIFKKINNIKYLIVEGIFAKEFSETIHNKKFFLLELKTNKKECLNRVVNRDLRERGKDKIQAEYDFLESWDLYKQKFKKKSIKKNVKEIKITKKTNIDKLLKKIIN